MSNAVIVGVLRAVEANAMVLSGGVRIIVPPTLEGVADSLIGVSVTVIIDKDIASKDSVAVSIRRTFLGFTR